MSLLRARYASSALVTLFAAACTSAPPPVTPKPVTSAQVADPTPPAAEVDLSPVAEPKNLVAVGRWKSAATTIETLKKMLQGTKVGKEFNRELDKALPAELAKVIKLDSSIDLSMALDPASRDDNPEVFIAFSVPFKSVEDVKGLEGAVEIKPGIYRIGSGKSKGWQCVAARSLGDAPIRLVCGQHDKDLDALLPWMIRGMPTANVAKTDMHLEFRAGPLQDRYRSVIDQGARFAPSLAAGWLSRELQIDDPGVNDVTRDLVGEGVLIASDLDNVSFDVGFDPNGVGVSLTSAVKLKGKKSWLARAITSNNGKAGAPPAIFWQAPADADTAAYNQGTDSKLWAPVLKGVGTLLGAALTKSGLAVADRDALKSVIADMPVSDGASASATGRVLPPGGVPVPNEAPASSTEVVKLSQVKLGTTLGWTISGFEAASAPYSAWARNIEKTYNRAAIQAQLKKLSKSTKDIEIPTVRVVPAPAGMPAGTVVVDFSVVADSDTMRELFFKRNWDAPPPTVTKPGQKPPPAPVKPPKAKGALSLKLIVMPDGANRTWIGFGADLDSLKTHLLAAKSDAPKDKTISTRAGLEALKNGSTTSGGFIAFGGMLSSFASTTSHKMSEREQKEMAAAIAAMPNKGQTPILLVGTGTNDATPTNSFEIRVQKATIDDVLAMIVRLQ